MKTALTLQLQYSTIREAPPAQKYELHSLHNTSSQVCHLTLTHTAV